MPSSKVTSERIPGRLRREFQITDIGAQSKSNTRSDRHKDNIVSGQCSHPEAANKIGRSADAGKTLVDCLGRRQAVDQHHGPRTLTAEIPSERRALPEHPEIAGILGVEHAFAVTQTAEKAPPASSPSTYPLGRPH